MQRLERLINLMAALLDAGRPLTRQDLFERVPGYSNDDAAFRRAFERDKEALRSMGVPITIEAVDPGNPEAGDGYRIPPEDYQLPDPGLEPDELAALHVAASAVQLEGAGGQEAIWKLGGSLGSGREVTTALPGSDHLPQLFEAISSRRSITFRHRDTTRTIDPYKLSFRTGHWYLVGHDHDRQQQRSFRVDRIAAVESVGDADSFAPHTGGHEQTLFPWQMGDEEPTPVQLRLDAELDSLVRPQLGDDIRILEQSDSTVTYEVPVRNVPAFRSFALGFLDRAEIVGPSDVRKDMTDWLDAIVAAS